MEIALKSNITIKFTPYIPVIIFSSGDKIKINSWTNSVSITACTLLLLHEFKFFVNFIWHLSPVKWRFIVKWRSFLDIWLFLLLSFKIDGNCVTNNASHTSDYKFYLKDFQSLKKLFSKSEKILLCFCKAVENEGKGLK